VAALDELLRLSRLDPDWSWRRCAVIARDWRRLDPLRAYAEALGIPIDMANEKPLTLWRMREMQGFVRALLADRTRLLTIPDLVAILNAQPQSRWTDLIGEGIGTLARELVEKAAPVPDLVQWFGEWARDVRGEQRGLLLMTAHRAKGLEFDHVAILNGGWDRPSRGEDADAPRRLFYVAMTRAQSTLTVLTDGPHAFVQPGDAILARRVTPDAVILPRARLRYVPPDARARHRRREEGMALGLCARRQHLRRQRVANGGLSLRGQPIGPMCSLTSWGLWRHSPGGRLCRLQSARRQGRRQ